MSWKNAMYVIKNAWCDDKKIVIFIILQAIAGCLIPLFEIYIPNIILQGVTDVIALDKMIVCILVMAAGMAVLSGMLVYIDSTMDALLINNRIFYLKKIYLKYMETDYMNIESDEGQNRFRRSMEILFNDKCGAYGMLKTLGGLSASCLGLFAYAGIVSMLSIGIVMMLIVTSTVHFFVLKHVTDYEIRRRDELVPLDRKTDYLFHKITDYKFGKEIRVYAAKGWLLGKLENLLREKIKWFVRIARYHYLLAVFDAAILIVRDGIAYFFILRAILNGAIRTDEFVLYFAAISGFSIFIMNVIEQIINVTKTSYEIEEIRSFFALPDRGVQNIPCDDKTLPDTVSVEFQHVSFI